VLYQLARHGALNRHLGVLPAYRGSDCPIWALASNDPERVGFTIHFGAEKVDTGDIVEREHVPIVPGVTFPGYLARLQRQASEAFVAVLDRLTGGAAVARERQVAGGRFFPPAGLTALHRARKSYEQLANARGATTGPTWVEPEKRSALSA
jgi:methionyl-tRNA formyltransferase